MFIKPYFLEFRQMINGILIVFYGMSTSLELLRAE